MVRVALVLGIAALGLGCADETTAPAQTPTPVASTLASGAQAVEGTIGPGAAYGLYLPEVWNGDLVLFAHGYYQFSLDLPHYADALRDGLLAEGYAVGWSTYSQVGFAIQDGAVRTAQLKALFTSRFTRPEHTFLMGESMGGAVVMRLVETRPQEFDGAVSACGIIGGIPMQLDHYWTVRALVDYFYPGVIPASPVTTDVFLAEVLPALVAAFGAEPGKLAQLAAVDQVGLNQFTDPGELVWAVVYPLMFATADWFNTDLDNRAHGRTFFDNSQVWYTGTLDDAALNAGVPRFRAHPDARNQIVREFVPSGKLGIPVLTLHATRDPVAPVRHETVYAEAAAAAGASDLLLQRIVDRSGHCGFDYAEQVAALKDLAAWVETGVKPAS